MSRPAHSTPRTVTGPLLPGEATLIASWRALARRSADATVDERPASVAAIFPAWEPLNNAIARVPVTDADATSAEVTRLAAQYRAAGVDEWAYWIASPTADLTTPDDATVAGLRRDTTTLVMVAELGPGLERHDGVVATSVESAAVAGDEPVWRDALDAHEPDAELQSWVLLRDGFAVAGLWACVNDGDCGIYAMGTAPQWRRQGLARSLIEHALAVVREDGARTASLQSTPMAVSLYRSLGFEAVGRYEEWVWGPTTTSIPSDRDSLSD